MDIYLVGGAVRDELLGLQVSERDWLVVGASPEDLLDRGYRPVGSDFPVFLHPENHEEYALARTERKKGRGYKGFAINSSPDVTLEQDLSRRDLTINAIARNIDGGLIDPHGGQRDLEAKILRHVSPAFTEDPLRVLRVARFAARFNHLGFQIAEETLELMEKISTSGELAFLTAERIFSELRRSLMEPSPQIFFHTLRQCGALDALLPELAQLYGVPQTKKYHPEIDTGNHVMLCLELAANLDASAEIRYALLLHDLGKGLTPEYQLPGHHGHEVAGLSLVNDICSRFKVPTAWRELALLVCEFHLKCHRCPEMKPVSRIKLLEACDAFRKPERFEAFLFACEVDARGRQGLQATPYPQRQQLSRLRSACARIDSSALRKQGFQGERLGEEIRKIRIDIASSL